MAMILQYHFLWREEKDISVFPLAWLIDICFLIIIDTAKKFLSASQLAVCNNMRMFRVLTNLGKPLSRFFHI